MYLYVRFLRWRDRIELAARLTSSLFHFTKFEFDKLEGNVSGSPQRFKISDSSVVVVPKLASFFSPFSLELGICYRILATPGRKVQNHLPAPFVMESIERSISILQNIQVDSNENPWMYWSLIAQLAISMRLMNVRSLDPSSFQTLSRSTTPTPRSTTPTPRSTTPPNALTIIPSKKPAAPIPTPVPSNALIPTTPMSIPSSPVTPKAHRALLSRTFSLATMQQIVSVSELVDDKVLKRMNSDAAHLFVDADTHVNEHIHDSLTLFGIAFQNRYDYFARSELEALSSDQACYVVTTQLPDLGKNKKLCFNRGDIVRTSKERAESHTFINGYLDDPKLQLYKCLVLIEPDDNSFYLQYKSFRSRVLVSLK